LNLNSNHKKWIAVFLRTTFALCVGYFVSKVSIDSFEFFFFDQQIKFRPQPRDTRSISLVTITQKTVEKFKGAPNYKFQAQALEKILSYRPKAVIYVSNLANWKGDNREKKLFADTAAKFEHVYIPTDELEMKGEAGKSQFAPPLDHLKVEPGPKTADTARFAKDGVTRRLLVTFQNKELLHPKIAGLYNPEVLDFHKVSGAFPVYDSLQAFIDYRPLGSYPVLTFDQLLNETQDPQFFENRIIIIGDDTGLDKRDYVYSPLARDADILTAAELHANMFETLIRNSAPVKAPDWMNLIFTILISILTVHVVLTLKPLKGILILLGTAAGFSVFAYLAFWPFGIWIDMAHPFLAIFLSYYFFIPYRLIMENRKSWEYYQKHKLLSEVETLKTNFIGMMSHDLKTPLARIQGMTEVISGDTAPLSTPQREALDMIKQSAEDLLKFISTILNYAKIESQGIELHLQAKDINQLLKDVVKKHEFHAKLKHIQMLTELEPLFSIQVDPELIKQAFSNLVENAIKYSPEHSKVLISSEEIAGQIVVQVADQGAGIPTDEQNNIFMKFFRSKNAKASPIKGSGLGLYLAKYFVELHQGTISCESSPDQGTTFTVELPIRA
jgi:signal transduction histidine kinase